MKAVKGIESLQGLTAGFRTEIENLKAEIKTLQATKSESAFRHIDSLTYNRMVGQGFSDLTDFQRGVIREVVCQQADFEHENAEVIETVLSSYSINGTAM